MPVLNGSGGYRHRYCYPRRFFQRNRFGLQWSGTNLGRDTKTYESHLTKSLGIGEDPCGITQSFATWRVAFFNRKIVLIEMNRSDLSYWFPVLLLSFDFGLYPEVAFL